MSAAGCGWTRIVDRGRAEERGSVEWIRAFFSPDSAWPR